MTKKAQTRGVKESTQIEELLSQLVVPDWKESPVNPELQTLALESQLVSIAGVSLDRETENLREILDLTNSAKSPG